jgi:hypothetical protein
MRWLILGVVVAMAACGSKEDEPGPIADETGGGAGREAAGTGGVADHVDAGSGGRKSSTGGGAPGIGDGGGAPGIGDGGGAPGIGDGGGAPGTGGGGGTTSAAGNVCGSTAVPGTPGVWKNVTPADLTIVPGREMDGGVEDVVVDPLAPSDFYAFAYSIPGGTIWKSTDYGATWARVSQTSIGSTFPCATTGEFCPGVKSRAWRSVIVPDMRRDPKTPPTFYASMAFGGGLHKSGDGGVHWTNSLPVGADNNDVCHIAISAWDLNHIVAGSHSYQDGHLYESVDGGQTWTRQVPIAGTAANPDLIFVDAGTLLATFDGDATPLYGTWRGTRSGATWPWTWTWTKVSEQQRFHGCHQFFIDPITHAILNGGAFGIDKSNDDGLTWTRSSKTLSGVIIGTATTLYSTTNYASGGTVPAHLQHATLDGTSWTEDPTPGGMTNGWHAAAVSCGSDHHVIVSGNWLAGLWRYVEP